MPVDIKGFKGSFRDLARANMYEVTIPGVSDSEYHCKAAQIPSETVGVIAVKKKDHYRVKHGRQLDVLPQQG